MKNFSWNCFQVTGSIDAYLLFKDLEELVDRWDQKENEQEEEEGDHQLES